MSPLRIIGKLHITTLFGPRLRAGSSRATDASGVGETKPIWWGRTGSAMSIACNPPERQESKTSWGSTVGLCVEYEVKFCVEGSDCDMNGSVFCRILNSPTISGWEGTCTSMIHIQPQGQPNDESVNFP